MKKVWRKRMVYGVIAFIFLSVPYIWVDPQFANDTPEYIAMYAYLPPLYPIFLNFLKILFGESLFIYAAVLLQTMFAAWIVTCLSELIGEVFQASKFVKVIIFILLLLTYYKADEYHPGCNLWILTEGISFSLFYVFVYYSIIFLKGKAYSAFAKLVVSAAALMLCRTQFIICFGMLVLYIIYIFIINRKEIKRVLCLVVGMAAGVVMVSAVQAGYAKIANPQNVNMFNLLSIGTHLYYYSTYEDTAQIESESEKQLFLDIYEEMCEKGYNYKGKEEKWLDGIISYKDSVLKLRGVVSDNIVEYVRQMGIEDSEQIDQIAGQVLGRQVDALASHFWLWTWDALKQFPVTMIRVVAIYPEKEYRFALRECLMIYTAVFYCLYVGLNIVLCIRKKGLQAENILCIFITLFTVGNAIVTEMTMRSIVRYVAYTFGLSYISGLLVLVALFQSRREAGNKI